MGKSFTNEKLTRRKLLQQLATDCGRDIIHPNIWVNSLMSEYKSKYADKDGLTTVCDTEDLKVKQMDHPLFEPSHFPNWFITDVRFPNEVKAIEDRGGIIIQIERNFFGENNDISIVEFEDEKLHESETSLDDYNDFDYIIENNGSLDALLIQVNQVRNKILNFKLCI